MNFISLLNNQISNDLQLKNCKIKFFFHGELSVFEKVLHEVGLKNSYKGGR